MSRLDASQSERQCSCDYDGVRLCQVLPPGRCQRQKCPMCGDIENFDGEWCRECGHVVGPTVLIAPAPTRTVWVCRCKGHHWDEKPRHVICAECGGVIREAEVVDDAA